MDTSVNKSLLFLIYSSPLPVITGSGKEALRGTSVCPVSFLTLLDNAFGNFQLSVELLMRDLSVFIH